MARARNVRKKHANIRRPDQDPQCLSTMDLLLFARSDACSGVRVMASEFEEVSESELHPQSVHDRLRLKNPSMQRIYLLIIFQAVALGQTASSTSLIASPSPSNYGQPVLLTATVTGGATGKVTFYDGVTILGVGTLSGAQASISTVMLPSGNRKLRAYYQGDGTYGASGSTIVTESVVAGKSLGLNAPIESPAIGPASSIAACDLNGDSRLDLVTVSNQTAEVIVYLGNGDGTFQSGVSYPVAAAPYTVVCADFNEDGHPDLAVSGASIAVLLGVGDGTFQAPLEYRLPANTIAVADFNSDGKADLVALLGSSSNNVAVLLGKGDGTFQSPILSPMGGASAGLITIGDFNDDGKPDLLLDPNSAVEMLLGNGDGTFQAPRVIPTNDSDINILSVQAADLDGDGHADIVVNSGTSVTTLIGNGDGTFGAPHALSATDNSGVALGDFDGDGIPDIVVLTPLSNLDHFVVAIASGNGDGTFGPYTYFYLSPLGKQEFNVSLVADFNGDGKSDLLIAGTNYAGNTLLTGGAQPDLSLAVRDGGFTQSQHGAKYYVTVSNVGTYGSVGEVKMSVTLAPGLTVQSVSGQGWSCTAASLQCTRTDAVPAGGSFSPIVLAVDVAAGQTGTLSSTFAVSGGGDPNLANNQATDTSFLRYPSSTTLTLSPNPSILGQVVSFTATVTSGTTGQVEFWAGTTSLGITPVVAGQASVVSPFLPAGSLMIRAVYSGDSNYGPSAAAQTQTVTSLPGNGFEPAFSAIPSQGFAPVAVGDFNGDGRADLAGGSGSCATLGINVLPGNGDGTFGVPINSSIESGGATATSFVVGDFNNDGKQDILANTTYGFVVYLGNGDGTFQPLPSLNVGSPNPYGISSSADINGDGNLDLIGIYRDESATAITAATMVMLGNGDGTFQPPTLLDSPAVSYYAFTAVADMNGDGIPDIVAAGSFQPIISVFVGNGDGTFQAPIDLTLASQPGSLLVGDFDGDGKSDVAVSTGNGVAVALGNGDGTLRTPQITPMAFGILTTSAADVNGDRKLDLVGVNGNAHGTTILFGNGDGTFQVGPTLPFTVGAVADLNHDGRIDFVALNSGAVQILLGGQFSAPVVSSAHGRFTAGETGTYLLTVTNPGFSASNGSVTVTDSLPAGLTATSITGWPNCALATLTCSRSDILQPGSSYPPITVTVGVSSNLPPSVVTNQISLSNGDNTASSPDPTTIVEPSSPTISILPNPPALGQPAVLTASLPAQATGEVLFLDNGVAIGTAQVANGHASISTKLLPAGTASILATYPGDGNYAPGISPAIHPAVVAAPANSLLPPSSYSTGAGAQSVALGDFNLDGILDLVTANSTANTVSVLLGHDDGTFGANTDFPAGSKPMAVAVADFNGDGKPDLVVGDDGTNSLSVLLGDGEGKFQATRSTQLEAGPVSIFVSDFNGDGKPDLLVNQCCTSTSVYLGNGDGTFTLSADCNCGPSLIGDFNNDGKIDFLTVNGLLKLGNGDGTFQPAIVAFSGVDTTAATSDLNGDGNLDVVAEMFNDVYVYLGNGDGTFRSLPVYNGGCCTPAALLLTDVDGDGKVDVVTSDGGYTKAITVLPGNGDGSFQKARSFSTSSGPYALVSGNFTSDGRTGFAYTSGSAIGVLLGALSPTLTISSSHSDPFAIGQSDATYSITVTNAGPGATSGTVSLTDTLPAGLAATNIQGDGWNCTLATLTCTNSTAILPNASYPAIAVSVSVIAAGTGSNAVSVSGGGAVGTATTSDPTTTVNPPITIQTTPPGLQFTIDNGALLTAPQTVNLAPGRHTVSVATTQSGTPGTQYVFASWSGSGAGGASLSISVSAPATYTATFQAQYLLITSAVPPSAGSVTAGGYYTAGTSVTLTETPAGTLTFTGWSNGATTTQTQLTLSAPAALTAYFDIPGATCTMTGDTAASIADVQFIVNEALGIVAANNDLTGDGAVNIADIQRVANAAMNLSCLH